MNRGSLFPPHSDLIPGDIKLDDLVLASAPHVSAPLDTAQL